MAGQGLFFRAPILALGRILTPSRLPQFCQNSGIKSKATETLKKLNVPEKPKKPLSPYFRFAQDQRQSIMKQNPDWKVTQVASQCAEEWKKIDPFVKAKYESTYKKEFEQYTQNYLKYMDSLTEEQKGAIEAANKEAKKAKARREKKKRLKETDRPKRPLGSYMLYVMDYAKSHPDKKYMELLSELKGGWAAMPAEEKAKFQREAGVLKEEYDKALVQWEAKMIQEGNMDVVRQASLKKKDRQTKKK